jgi:hypothetical protein
MFGATFVANPGPARQPTNGDERCHLGRDPVNRPKAKRVSRDLRASGDPDRDPAG